MNEIQQAIRQLDGGAFQKLADDYLRRQGYTQLCSIGSVAGKNKTRVGTPDAYVAMPDGRYVFAEYTTQAEGLAKKLAADLAKCLDESKTGIPASEISGVILCFVGELAVGENQALCATGQAAGVTVTLIGLSQLASDLRRNHPGLALEYLGVAVDTGQVLSPEEFVLRHDAKRSAAPLDIGFCLREDQRDQITALLDTNGVVILSGPPGTGKTRLALAVCEQFGAAHPGCRVYCLLDRGRDLYDDLVTYLSEPGDYLIFVDDANRARHFGYVLDFLARQSEGRRYRIVATVRNYARDGVIRRARDVVEPHEVVLRAFTHQEMAAFLGQSFPKLAPHAVDRTQQIAWGNPRLAVMAARIALETNRLDSIANVGDLYAEYFDGMLLEQDALNRADLGRAAAIVALFRMVDRSDAEQMAFITSTFSVAADAFWEAVETLHRMEIVDLHDGEVAKMSEQVLATYLFYLCVFDRKWIRFDTLMEHFFPDRRSQLVDAVAPVLRDMGSAAVWERVGADVKATWQKYGTEGRDDARFLLMEAFFPLLETETLLELKRWVGGLAPEPLPPDQWCFEADKGTGDGHAAILGRFGDAGEDNRAIALELLLDWVARRHAGIPQALDILIRRVGFHRHSGVELARRQRAVADAVWKRSAEGADALFTQLFLALAAGYLQTHFEGSASAERFEIQWYYVNLRGTEDIAEVRVDLWQRIFALYRLPEYQDAVLDTVRRYFSRSHHDGGSVKVLKLDAGHVCAFMGEALDPGRYDHALFVQDYLEFLRRYGIKSRRALARRFRHPTWLVYRQLCRDRARWLKDGLTYAEFEARRRKEQRAFFARYRFGDYLKLLDQCREILDNAHRTNMDCGVNDQMTDVLVLLAERDGGLFRRVITRYLRLGDPLRLWAPCLVPGMLEVMGVDAAKRLLAGTPRKVRTYWLLAFYAALQPEQIAQSHIRALYARLRQAGEADLPRNLDFLLRYRALDERVIPKALTILLDRSGDGVPFWPVKMLFSEGSEVARGLADIFANDMTVLERAHHAIMRDRNWPGGLAKVFNHLLDADPEFVLRHIDSQFSRCRHTSVHDDHNDYGFLWRREDHHHLMVRVTRHIAAREAEDQNRVESYLAAYFRVPEGRHEPADLLARQDAVLDEVIRQESANVDLLRPIFLMVSEWSDDRRRRHIASFLQHNQDIAAFKQLDIEPRSWSASGSFVPVWERQKQFLQSLVPLCAGVALLEHRASLELRVGGYGQWIAQEKRREFMGY
ncbi:MAG: hypothetical protein HZA24_05935 [Nitrospirae bacterium]|nr:hypothetical protein [Nitrospirota bacterium]